MKDFENWAKALVKIFGVVGLEPRSSSLEHTWLTPWVWSIAPMRRDIVV